MIKKLLKIRYFSLNDKYENFDSNYQHESDMDIS